MATTKERVLFDGSSIQCHDGCESPQEGYACEYCFDDEIRFLVDELDFRLDYDILVIADLGTWQGRRQGYKRLSDKVLSCLELVGNDGKLYIEGNNLLGVQPHHDGTNYYTFRLIRSDREEGLDNLLSKIYNGEEVSNRQIGAYTSPIGDVIKEKLGMV